MVEPSPTRVVALLVLVPVECTDEDLPKPFARFPLCLEALGVVLLEDVGEVPFGVLGPLGGSGNEL